MAVVLSGPCFGGKELQRQLGRIPNAEGLEDKDLCPNTILSTRRSVTTGESAKLKTLVPERETINPIQPGLVLPSGASIEGCRRISLGKIEDLTRVTRAGYFVTTDLIL